jgi:exodeoxyribonuclease-3
MKIATWNINGLRARFETLSAWLRESAPDVAILQETKIPDELFPHEELGDLGYTTHAHGQKGFNGVALLSRVPLEDVTPGLPGDEGDEQARYIEATAIGADGAIRLCGLYLPNGNPAPGEKYDYKLAWMRRLRDRAVALLEEETPFLMAGDYNVLPADIDLARPEVMRDDALMLPPTREAWRRLLNLGLTEAFRTRHPGQPGHYSYWDYQGGAFERNHGLRIDHVLLSPAAADMMRSCSIEAEMRARRRPSDHVPVWIEIDI